MAAKRRTVQQGPPSVASTCSDDADKDDSAYKLKRQRNNDAVKKTRAKSKQTANERKQHVKKLQEENLKLETEINEMKKQVNTLKQLLLKKLDPEEEGKMIEEIMAEYDDAT